MKKSHALSYFFVLLGLVAMGAGFYGGVRWKQKTMEPLAAMDLPTYIQLSMPFRKITSFLRPYRVVLNEKRQLALPDDPPTYHWATVNWSESQIAQKRALLQRELYDGQSVLQVLFVPTCVAVSLFFLVLFVAGFIVGPKTDTEGPKIISRWQWNRRSWFQKKIAIDTK